MHGLAGSLFLEEKSACITLTPILFKVKMTEKIKAKSTYAVPSTLEEQIQLLAKLLLCVLDNLPRQLKLDDSLDLYFNEETLRSLVKEPIR